MSFCIFNKILSNHAILRFVQQNSFKNHLLVFLSIPWPSFDKYSAAFQRKCDARHFNYCKQTDKKGEGNNNVHGLLFCLKETNNKIVCSQKILWFLYKENYWLHFGLLMMRSHMSVENTHSLLWRCKIIQISFRELSIWCLSNQAITAKIIFCSLIFKVETSCFLFSYFSTCIFFIFNFWFLHIAV